MRTAIKQYDDKQEILCVLGISVYIQNATVYASNILHVFTITRSANEIDFGAVGCLSVRFDYITSRL